MIRFIKSSDYNVQIRSEIAKIIDNTVDSSKLVTAEAMAIDQISNFLGNAYDLKKIFAVPDDNMPDTRDMYIVMIVIDIALYHLWSKEGGNNIPKNRELRYNDALEWLKAVQYGHAANLPKITDNNGNESTSFRIWSEHPKTDNRY